MNREYAVVAFIKNNFKLLQQKDFPTDLYKKTKHDYFFPQKSTIGIPKDSEIASVAIFYMVRTRIIQDESRLQVLLGLPFFKKNIFNPVIFFEALKLKNPNSFVVIEPSKLDNIEYVQQIESDIKNKVLVENQSFFEEERQKFKKEIDEMKKNFLKIPTKLNKHDFEEPVVEEPEEQIQKEWWQILNLKGDPFPLAEGFQRIEQEIYEDVVVRTDIFNKYVNYVENLKDQIFKNTIFYGEFGSGKTAFFDYLRGILFRNKILSVYVQMWIAIDNDTNNYHFEEELISKLLEECKRFNVIINNIDHSNHFVTINEILKNLVTQSSFTGFVIFVDDLHKNTKAFEAVLDFLSYLQIFTSKITKNHGTDLAIFVAGIPQWKNIIDSEPRLSGSLIRDEFMPPVSEHDAYNMLNKRMSTFSKNPDKKNIIGPAFVKKIYEYLKQNGDVITFRVFLKRALDEFKNGNFDTVLIVNPRAISTNILHNIHEIIYANPKLSYQFDELFNLTSTAHQENKQKCFEILGNIYLERGILDSSPQVDRRSWEFQQLVKSGLINFIEEIDDIRWVVNKDLYEINKKIIEKYNVSLEDYIIPAFLGTSVYMKKKKMDSKELEILDIIYNEKENVLEKEMIKDVIKNYTPLLQIIYSHRLNIEPKELVEKCIETLAKITRTFMLFHKIAIPEESDKKILSFWKYFWFNPSATIEFVNLIDDIENLEINRANFIFGMFDDAFREIVSFMNSQEQKDRIFSMPSKNLTNEDCKILDQSRDYWMKKDYFNVCASVVTHLEITLRKNISNILLLVYGNEEHRNNRFDQKIIKSLEYKQNNDEKRGFAEVKDILQQFDRKEYKILMTKGPELESSEIGHSNWEELFKHIFSPWTENDLYNFLNQFGDYNTLTSHNKEGAITNSQQPILLQFITNSIFFLERLNSSYRKLIKKGIVENDGKFYFSFTKNIDMQSHQNIDASKEEFSRIKKRMLNMKEIEVPMNDSEYILKFYNLNYRTFVMIVGLLLNMDQSKKEQIGAELVILNDNSPNFSFQLKPI